MKNLFRISVLIAAVFLFAACGSSSSSSGTSGGTGINNADAVTGTVYSASGDPVPGATVYIPGTTVTAQVTKTVRSHLKTLTASDGTTCDDPPSADGSLASGCTAADGTFSIDTSSITSNPTQIVFVRGSLRMVQDLSCSSTTCALSSSSTTFGSGTTTWPRVAVVTGLWDRMEDVLAKIGDTDTSDSTNGQYGRVDNTSGIFVYGSEFGTNLTIIDGTGSTAPTENTTDVTYYEWSQYLDGTYPLVSGGSPVFDVIFINCGADETWFSSNLATGNTALQDFVNAGGRLYVTDLAYDYIEQPFPSFIKFEGDPDSTSTPGDMDDAQQGTSGITVDAAPTSALISWLGTVSVNRHDASTPGNPDLDCTYDASYEQFGSALTSGNLIPIGDFLSGWAHMTSAHTGQSPTIWISSGSGVTFDGLADRPLTASMSSGSNDGTLLYSSYHTAHSCPSTGFWPQERVLQYLIFQAF